MKLLVGLGNPGAQYARHRHNVGFRAADAIAARHGLGPWRKRFSGVAADGTIDGERVLVLKPQTYMNDSGRAVGEAARFLKIGPGDIIVLHDELDLAPGKLKVKSGGGNAGHNGLRSITAHLGNDYWRVRIGIGHPGVKELVHHWVLGDFAKADAAWLDPLLDAMAEAAGHLAKGDDARFLSEVARILAAAKERKARPQDGASKAEAPKPVEEKGGPLASRIRDWLKQVKS
jgi:PTH1 family peptidyl-tRNA hydrolase